MLPFHSWVFLMLVSIVDVAALVLFVVCWVGYSKFAIMRSKTTPCLANILHGYRRQWMTRLLERGNRMQDTTVIANLERNVTFFASSSLLILAGIVAVLGATEKAMFVLDVLPFMIKATRVEWELKLIVLLVVFIYAFFKFTWSLRQYNFLSVLIGAAPRASEEISDEEKERFINQSSRIASLAGHQFNFGLRSFYFGLAVLAWFLHPVLFVVVTLFVVRVLYRREFKSSTLKTMSAVE